MINVRLILDKQVIREYEFPARMAFVTIGRRPSHHIHIDNLAVSVDHARLIFEANDIVIVDMNSSNGTLLNGIPVNSPTIIGPGDIIQIAKFFLTVTRQTRT